MRHTGGSNQAVVASIGTDWIFGLGDNKSAYLKWVPVWSQILRSVMIIGIFLLES